MSQTGQTRDGARILIARPDRIGDVVLSTPVFRAVRQHLPKAHVTVAVRSLVAPLLDGLDAIDSLFVFDPEGLHAGWAGFWRLVSELKGMRLELAITLQSHRRLSWALLFAGVPVRIGPTSRLHTYFCFNRGVRQRRSQVLMHEADYNLQLLEPLGLKVQSRSLATQVHVADSEKRAAAQWLSERAGSGSGPWVAVHPGMGGSALNWPEECYAGLVTELVRRGHRVVVTGGGGERELVSRVAAGQASEYVAGPGETVARLAALFAQCGVVVAPSTGPLHVAVAVGRPVVTFYPRIKVQSPERWGPYYPVWEGKAVVFTPPDVLTPMASIPLERAVEEVEKLLAVRETGSQPEEVRR